MRIEDIDMIYNTVPTIEYWDSFLITIRTGLHPVVYLPFIVFKDEEEYELEINWL